MIWLAAAVLSLGLWDQAYNGREEIGNWLRWWVLVAVFAGLGLTALLPIPKAHAIWLIALVLWVQHKVEFERRMVHEAYARLEERARSSGVPIETLLRKAPKSVRDAARHRI